MTLPIPSIYTLVSLQSLKAICLNDPFIVIPPFPIVKNELFEGLATNIH